MSSVARFNEQSLVNAVTPPTKELKFTSYIFCNFVNRHYNIIIESIFVHCRNHYLNMTLMLNEWRDAFQRTEFSQRSNATYEGTEKSFIYHH